MATLEQITRGEVVRGILAQALVASSDVRWIGTVAIEVTGKATSLNYDLAKLAQAKEPV